MKTALNTRIFGSLAAASLAFGFAAMPLSVGINGGGLSLSETKAFARQGADDPAGHTRKSRGADDAPGHIRGGRGADDAPGHVRGGKGADDRSSTSSSSSSSSSKAGDDHGGRGRGRGNDGPNHK